VLDRLAHRLSDRATRNGNAPRSVLVIDDLDRLDDPLLAQLLDRVAGADDLRVIAALESRSMTGYTTSAMVTLIRRSRRRLVLQPDDPGEFLQMTGVALPSRPGLRQPPGRGVLVSDRTASIIQVACLGDSAGEGWSTGPRPPGVPDRPAATPDAATPSASTPESVACDRQPARR
jgi:S-DNA-T family DNA segregation ATPase FtsK/SpoIIIE